MLWYCSTPLIKQVTSCAAVPQLSHCSRCLWKDRSIYRRSTDSHARLLLFYLGLQLESQSVQTMLEICAVCLLIKHVFSLSLLSGSTKTWTYICILFQSIWEFRKTDKPIENDSPKTYYTAQNDPPPLQNTTIIQCCLQQESQEPLNIKWFILPTHKPVRCRQDQSISPVTLSNMSLYLLIRFRDNKWKDGLSGPFAFTNGSFLIWEINRLLSNLPCDWSYDLVT